MLSVLCEAQAVRAAFSNSFIIAIPTLIIILIDLLG